MYPPKNKKKKTRAELKAMSENADQLWNEYKLEKRKANRLYKRYANQALWFRKSKKTVQFWKEYQASTRRVNKLCRMYDKASDAIVGYYLGW